MIGWVSSVLFLGVCMGPLISSAYSVDLKDEFAGKMEFNDIKSKQFGDFTKTWDLVTVRFREDNGELRWVYANRIAIRNIEKKSKVYDDGAIFAKVGILTGKDHLFPSSRVPKEGKRIQYMVKDSRKYSDTGGWGYALFDPLGKTFPGNPKDKIQACFACHQVAKDFDYVFSRRVNISPFDPLTSNYSAPLSRSSFGTALVHVESVPVVIRAQLNKSATYAVNLKEKNLSAHAFFGTLDELQPMLIEIYTKELKPVYFHDVSLKNWIVLQKSDSESVCSKNQLSLKISKSSSQHSRPTTTKLCVQ
jgi:hypothetical protein